MTYINADSALTFLRQLTEYRVRVATTTNRPEYARGAADLAEQYAMYLEGLMRDPESDREVAA